MKLSARTEYACIAMLHLASRYGAGEPVRLRSIAQEHGIPPRYLVQIFLQLKAVGLVRSVRGAAGGYQLSRSPHEISLLDVIDVIEGDSKPTTNAAGASPLVRVLAALCEELSDTHRERLSALTLANLSEEAHAQHEPMWYI